MEALRLHDEPDWPGEDVSLPSWRDHAACLGMDTEVFFDNTAEGVAKAKAVCADCSVWEDCLDLALEDSLEGVFGGMTADERRDLLSGRPRRRSPMRRGVQPCGTHAAYQRHRKHGETPCEACREANRVKAAQRRQEARSAA